MNVKANILVVDDNKDLGSSIKEYLEEEGYAIKCAHSGKEAITQICDSRYDIALVDIKLPDIQGTELVKKLTEISPSTDFIHITAHADLSSAIEAVRQEHVISYETKPLDMDHLLALLKQIIKQKKTEEALMRAEKLKSIGTVTAGVSHEFNNILAIISGNIQLMMGTYKDHKRLVKSLSTVLEAVNEGAEISSKMDGFTNEEADTTDFETNRVSDLIKQSVEFTMPRWKNMAHAGGINYHINMDGVSEIPLVYCNPVELREVFINIINNALDAMPDGGTITVSTRYVESPEFKAQRNEQGASEILTLNSKLKGDFVEIIFNDTGKGMSEDVKKRVFDPFFTTRRPLGTGLGLSTSFGIITRHGGKIEVESRLGRGSIFYIQLPVYEKTDSAKEISDEDHDIKGKCLHVLVVDDEKEICDMLEKFLSSKGHMVRTVDNGAEAIILARASNYDLILCDLAMPEVFGYDVIKALNEMGRIPKIGIITGWGEKLKPVEDDALKVDFIIKKPFDFSEVTKHVNSVFSEN